VLFLDEYKVSKSFKKFLKKHPYRVTKDAAFEQVIKACALIPRDDKGTWITNDMQHAYIRLHKAGFAHSVEVWEDDELVGGLYGIGIGNVFCGESMFHKRTNASKLAFYHLVQHMAFFDCQFIDCQMQTEHLSSLGVKSLNREDFLQLLRVEQDRHHPKELWQGPLQFHSSVKMEPSATSDIPKKTEALDSNKIPGHSRHIDSNAKTLQTDGG
jgi:leucyl/phenylalanyl-tRNA--protein transferase